MRKIGYIFLGLMIIIVGLLFIPLPLGESIRAEITQKIEAATGRQVEIQGGLSVRVLPTLQVEASGVRFSNPSWAKNPDFLKAESVGVELDTFALLSDQIKVEGIVGDNVQVYFEQKSKTENSMTFLKKKEKIEKEIKDSAQNIVEAEADKPLTVTLESVNLDNVLLSYLDHPRNSQIAAKLESADVSLSLDQDIRMEGDIGVSKLMMGNANAETDEKKVAYKAVDKASLSKANTLFSTETFDLSALKQMRLDLNIEIEEAIVSGSSITDINMDIDADGQTITLDLDDTQWAKGTGTFFAQLNLLETPAFNLTGNYKNEAFDNILQELKSQAKAKPGEGDVDLEFDLKAAGNSPHAIASKLDGFVRFKVDEVAFESSSIEFLGRSIFTNMLPGPLQNLVAKEDKTLRCVVGGFDVKEGVANPKALLVDTELLQIKGEGLVNFGQERLKLTLIPKPKSEEFLNLPGLPIIIKITGSFMSPNVQPTVSVASAVKGVVTTVVDTPKDIIGGVLGGLAGGAKDLGEAFKGAVEDSKEKAKAQAKEALEKQKAALAYDTEACEKALQAAGY